MNDSHKTDTATPDFWSSRWTAGQIGFHRPAPNERLVSEFDRAYAPRRGRVLDPLCGKSLDLTWLATRFDEVVGVEFVEQAALDYARESGRPHHVGPWGDAGPTTVSVDNVRIVVGDFFACDPSKLGHFDAAYDRAALIALPPALRKPYVRHLASLLTSDASALIVTLDYPQAMRAGPPFAVSDAEVATLFGVHGTVERLTHEPSLEPPSGLATDLVTTSTFRFLNASAP